MSNAPQPLRLGVRYYSADGSLTAFLEANPAESKIDFPFRDPFSGLTFTASGQWSRGCLKGSNDLLRSEDGVPTPCAEGRAPAPSEPPFTNTSLGKLLDEKSDAALSAKLDAFKSTAWEALDKVAPRHRWTNVSVEFKTPQRVSVVDLLRTISEAIRKQDLEPARRDFVDEFLRRVDGLSKRVDNLHEEIDTLRR